MRHVATRKVKSLLPIIYVAVYLAVCLYISAVTTVSAAEFCQEWNTWEQAPFATDWKKVIEFSKRDMTSRYPKKLDSDQLEQAVVNLIKISSQSYCYRNQKTCLNGAGKCSRVSHCEVGSIPRQKGIEPYLSEIEGALVGGEDSKVMVYLDASGLIPRTRKICCSDEAPADFECKISRDSKFSKLARKSNETILAKLAETHEIKQAVEGWDRVVETTKAIEQTNHPDCRNPVKVPQSLLSPSHEATLSAFSKAWQMTLMDIATDAHPEPLAEQMVTSSQLAVGAGAPAGSVNALTSALVPLGGKTSFWATRMAKYYTTLNMIPDPDKYFIDTVGMTLEEADPSVDAMIQDLKEDFKREQHMMKPPQVTFMAKLLKKVDKISQELRNSKAKGLIHNRGQDILTHSVEHNVLGNPIVLRKSDLNSSEGANLQKILKNLVRAVRLTGYQNPIVEKGLKARCEEQIKVHPEFKKFLIQKAMGLASRSADDRTSRGPSDTVYAFSEPGTLKTTGFKELAACTGVPICIINQTTLTDKKYEGVSFAERLKQEVIRCLKKDLLVAGEERFAYSSLILVDDIDQILDNHLNPARYESPNPESSKGPTVADHTAAELRQKRTEFLQVFKDLIDPTQLFPDPKSGFPIDLSGIFWAITGNSIPPEFNSKKSGSAAAFGSRVKMYSLPFPREAYRTYLARGYWAAIEQELKSGNMTSDPSCKDNLQEIADYDIDMWKVKDGRMGVRALFQFLDDYKAWIKSEMNDLNPGDQVSCKDFVVAERAIQYRNEYSREANESIKEYDFSSLVMKAMPGFLKEKKRLKLAPKAVAHLEKLEKIFEDEKKKLSDRQKALTDYRTSLEFAMLKGKRQSSGSNSEVYYSIEEIKDRFLTRFKPVLSEGEGLRQWKDFASETARKTQVPPGSSSAGGPNLTVVLDPQVGADDGLVDLMAETFAVPTHRVKYDQAFSLLEPGWWKFKTPSTGLISTTISECYDLGLAGASLEVSYDKLREAYIGKLDSKRRIVLSLKSVESHKCLSKDNYQIVTPEELNDQPAISHNWLSNALSEWKESGQPNQRAGMVVIEVDSEHVAEAQQRLQGVLGDRAYVFPAWGSGGDQAVRDMTKFTVILAPPEGKAWEPGALNAIQKDQKVFRLRLPGISGSAPELLGWAKRRGDGLIRSLANVGINLEYGDTEKQELENYLKGVIATLDEKVVSESGASASGSDRSGSAPLGSKLDILEKAVYEFVEGMKRESVDIFEEGRKEFLTPEVFYKLLENRAL